jgi:XTP/dITP diphosphohydrolase
MLKLETIEIQSDDLETIAKTRVSDAVKKCGLHVIVEDAGLFIKALKGFPGPYASYVYKTIGNEGLLKLMENKIMRNAYFESVVAFYGPKEKEPLCFRGRVDGRISLEVRGDGGFGFDPVFIPNEGDGRTFAEMKITEKNVLSHRARALNNFAQWYKSI